MRTAVTLNLQAGHLRTTIASSHTTYLKHVGREMIGALREVEKVLKPYHRCIQANLRALCAHTQHNIM
jgi:hypothetical protein